MALWQYDQFEIARAISTVAMPALQRLAENSSRLERALERRFGRDEPPRYVSSTEDEDEEETIARLLPGPAESAEMKRHLDEPLDDNQILHAAKNSSGRVYDPGPRYEEEIKLEKQRIEHWIHFCSKDIRSTTRNFFIQRGRARQCRPGQERVNIIARRNIRQRWQKLGIWNSEWGIPNRADNPQSKDDTMTWKWPWQHGDAAAEWHHLPFDEMSQNSHHPIMRALRLREGQRRSEHNPVLPRSHLGRDVSVFEAESFIMSRPWFMFKLETCEERVRVNRLPWRVVELHNGPDAAWIKELWEERGEWKEDWSNQHRGEELIGWKWRHESPSPEPEDLTGIDDLGTFELTPSETDALEAVRPASPPTPPPIFTAPLVYEHFATSIFNFTLPPPRPRRRRQQPSVQPTRRSARIAVQSPRRSARIFAMSANPSVPARVSKPPARPRRLAKKNSTL